jgi:hypothetical protein
VVRGHQHRRKRHFVNRARVRPRLSVRIATQNRSVWAYSEVAESWKPDHDLVLASEEFNDLLDKGLKTLRSIQGAHDSWFDQVMNGVVEPSLATDQGIWDLYSWWLRPVARLERELAFFEGAGFPIENAAAFREALQALHEDRGKLSRPTVPLRPFTSAEHDAMSR